MIMSDILHFFASSYLELYCRRYQCCNTIVSYFFDFESPVVLGVLDVFVLGIET